MHVTAPGPSRASGLPKRGAIFERDSGTRMDYSCPSVFDFMT